MHPLCSHLIISIFNNGNYKDINSWCINIEHRIYEDVRGYFFESFSQREFDEKMTPILGHTVNFVQDNESKSCYGIMRGLHFQRPPFTQSKLVRCLRGAVLDVAVDIRKGSHTYGQYVECLLTDRDEEGVRIAKQFEEEALTDNRSPLSLAYNSSFRRALILALLCFQRPQYSSTSVMSSIILRLMEASVFLMTRSVLIGALKIRRF